MTLYILSIQIVHLLLVVNAPLGLRRPTYTNPVRPSPAGGPLSLLRPGIVPTLKIALLWTLTNPALQASDAMDLAAFLGLIVLPVLLLTYSVA